MHTRTHATHPFRLDAGALALAGASGTLAIDARALGALQTLSATAATNRRLRTRGAIGIVEVYGPLSQRASEFACGWADGYQGAGGIVERFATTLADSAVSAVVLRIDSPGGDAAGMVAAVESMVEAKRRSGKPVFAFADELAASAAYGLATVADAIYAPSSGFVGSIGTVAIHLDETKALEADGVAVRVFRSVTRKMEGASFEPLSTDAAKAKQAAVDALALGFAEVVARARAQTAAQILALEGRLVMAQEGVRLGLIDGVTAWDTLLAKVEADVAAKRPATTRPTATRASVTHAVAAAVPAPRFSAAEIAAASPSMKAHMARANAQDAAVGQRLAELAGRPGSAAQAEAAELAHAGNAFASRQAQLRAQRERHEAAASTAPLVPPGRYEELGGDVLHNLRATDAALYQALRADWERRGRPSRTVRA